MRQARAARLVALALLVQLGGACAHGPPRFDPRVRRTCLVLSVGGARAVAHLGAIAAAKQAGLRIDCVVGNSMGALVGALYASAPAEETEVRFRRLAAAYARASEEEARRNGVIGALIGAALGAASGGTALPLIAAGGGYLIGAAQTAEMDRDRLVRALDGVTGGARIDALPVPFATTYQQRAGSGLQLVAVRAGNLADAVGKSIANPYIFTNLDVVAGGQVDPGADRAAMTPVDDACRLFPDANLLAINVTAQPAFYTAEMRCPLREVRVDVGAVDARAVFRLEADFERAVKAGADATAQALR